MARSKALVPSLEGLGGAGAGALLVLLPMTPLLYLLISWLVLVIVGNMVWRITDIIAIRPRPQRWGAVAGGVIILGMALYWGWIVRFGEQKPGISSVTAAANGPGSVAVMYGGTQNNNFSEPGFSQTQTIRLMPTGMGGNRTLYLDDVGTMTTFAPTTGSMITMLVDAPFVHLPDVTNGTAHISNHEFGMSRGPLHELVFDLWGSRQHEVTVSGHVFSVKLIAIRRLQINAVNPDEYVFGVREK